MCTPVWSLRRAVWNNLLCHLPCSIFKRQRANVLQYTILFSLIQSSMETSATAVKESSTAKIFTGMDPRYVVWDVCMCNFPC